MPNFDIAGFDAAVEDIRPALSETLMWLVPEDEKHFDGVTILSGLALALVTSFLAGFQEEASKQVKAAGGAAAQWLAAHLRSITHGEDAVPAEVQASAEAAPRLALDPAERHAALSASEAAIRNILGESMPPEQAAEVAAKIRAAVEQQVLPKPA